MKISTTPNKLPDCVHTDPNVRWIMRQQSVHHMGDDVSETVMVLQQLLQDGWGNDFWADVQIKQRNKPMTKLEELKAAYDAAFFACDDAWSAYHAELKREQTND